MTKCEKCLHYKACYINSEYEPSPCRAYKNKDDVVEVVHGEWIESFNFGYWHYDCPFCDDGYAVKERDETKPNYCQNCGAKMDGERKEQE